MISYYVRSSIYYMSKVTVRLSRAELQLMKHFWGRGERSVREIQESLDTSLAYTTVQTLIARLEEKGALRRTRKIGNAVMFEASVTERSIHERLIDEFLEVFGGSAQPLVAHLFESGRISLEDLQKLEKATGNEPSGKGWKPRK
ncbi:MAG: BlaI/MecI/CopY family transcriptional regulator [Thermoanaerobaculia bacterium]